MLCLYIICHGSSSRRQYQRRRCVKVWRGKNLWISLTVRDWRHDGALWRPNAQLHSAKTQHRSGPTASRSIYQRPKRGSESHREHLYHTIITLSDRARSKYIHQKQQFHFCQKAFVPFRTACNIHVKFSLFREIHFTKIAQPIAIVDPRDNDVAWQSKTSHISFNHSQSDECLSDIHLALSKLIFFEASNLENSFVFIKLRSLRKSL